jgi:hypothetical protein
VTAVAPVVIDCDGLWVGWTGLDNFNTGYSFSELLILKSIDPKYDNRLFIELQVQYKQNYNFSKGAAENWQEFNTITRRTVAAALCYIFVKSK